MKDAKLDVQNLTGIQKTAVFLLTMGENYTTQIFRSMSEEEIKIIANVMAQIDQIPPDVVTAVMEEFASVYEDENRLLVGGEYFAKNVIGKTLAKDKAERIYKEIEENKREVPFNWSREVNPAILASYLASEHPQTIAMILTHLPAENSAEILMALPDEKKGDIALRIAKLGQVSDDVVRDVDEALRNEIGNIGSGSTKSGGVPTLVDILNGVDKATEDAIMEKIEEEQADMVDEIRKLMFVFEDLTAVDDRGMREILKKVESGQLTLAMKTASEEMKKKILGNLSSRAAEMLLEDLEVMGPAKLSDVEAAQQAIVSAAKELEADGTITLGKGGGDILV
ncbi:MAG: flagellar motor switch protein FliG [Thermodesulfobacteriota bacterium]